MPKHRKADLFITRMLPEDREELDRFLQAAEAKATDPTSDAGA